mgnify:CR=1 FL=1
MMPYIFLALSIILGASGHLLTKTALTRTGIGLSLIFDPFVIGGVICYFVSFLAFMPWLASRPAGVAVPAAGLTYALVAALGYYKGDIMTIAQICGIVLVGTGVWLLAH